jgi:membrane protein implicated in regulation of membrane protease activity
MIKRSGWSIRTVVRYGLFQIPGFLILILVLMVVRRWLDLPAWFTWGLLGFWLAKEIGSFFLLWRLYEPAPSKGTDFLIGTHGIAEERLAPRGYIRVRNELWKAEAMGSRMIEKGETVHIRATRGLTLLVDPEREELASVDSRPERECWKPVSSRNDDEGGDVLCSFPPILAMVFGEIERNLLLWIRQASPFPIKWFCRFPWF